MFLFGKKSKTYLGLDIGASAIKLVELGKDEGRYRLENYGIFPLGEYLKHLEKGSQIKSLGIPEKQMAEMIKQTIQESKIKSRKVSISIPVYSSFSTLIDLPPMPEKEIVQAIPFEARKYIPAPISEVILDWSVIEKIKEQPIDNTAKSVRLPNSDAAEGSSAQNADGQKIKKIRNEKESLKEVQVLLVAVPKDVINKYDRIIRLAGLKLEAIEAETFSLARSLVGNDKSPIVIVDTGDRSSNISIVDRGYIRITHNLEIGGKEITKSLSQRMNISYEEAEEIKKTISRNLFASQEREFNPGAANQLSGFEIKETAHPVLEAISDEVKKIIDHYQIKYNRRIEKCILAGSGLVLTGLVDDFAAKLDLEIFLGNPFARIIYFPILEPVIREIGPSLAVAVGLAMRE
jgi:type IV pilus assembly protein PilM